MEEEIELTREELGALVAIDDATRAGKATSKDVDVSTRLEQYVYVVMTPKGLVSTPKGQKWIEDNSEEVKAYFKGEQWIKKQMSKGKWV
jgi:hypothetical protein